MDDSYKLPFRFTGKIDKLTYKLGPEQMTNDEQKLIRHALEKSQRLGTAIADDTNGFGSQINRG